jgi:PAS domain S-box-containing protein
VPHADYLPAYRASADSRSLPFKSSITRFFVYLGMYTNDDTGAANEMLTLFQLTPDLVCIADRDGFFKNFNPAVSQTLGYSREELFARPIADFIHPDDREITASRRLNLLKGENLLNFQNRYVAKDGNTVWLEWTSVYLSDTEVVFAIAKNITSRKMMEQQVHDEYVNLRQQSARLKHELEKDKKYLAMQLHEELAQLAGAIRVDVDWIGSNVPAGSANFNKRIQHALVTTDLLIDTVRRISFSISPGMLDDLGLDATLQWYCSEFSVSSGIDCTYESNFNDTALSKEVALDFFRMCQEVLDDAKHKSRPTKVQVSITQNEGTLALKIQHDGAGYTEDSPVKSGLFSVQERAASISATVFRDSVPGKGTTMSVVLKM